MGLEIPDEGEITNGNLSYSRLINHIDDGVVHIPEFQREFVWNEQKILDLLDSIYKSYPIGSFIFWVTSEDFAYSAPIGDNETNDSIYKHRFFVIDGQQRLKSLYHAATNTELEMESGTKQVDVVFDLLNEKFLLEKNIRNRRKSIFPIPGVRNNQMVLGLLEAVEESTISDYQSEYALSENQLEYFLRSLSRLGLLVQTDEEYEISDLGSQILVEADNQRIAKILVNNVEFVKYSLEIIQENPSISRSDAVPAFQSVYGGSESTAYQQFGRRCKWLRALNIIEKQDGGYYLKEAAEEILEDIRETEKEITSRYVPLNRILVDTADIDYDYLGQFTKERRDKINELRRIFGDYGFSIILVNKTDWEEVCDIFERINTQGQHLTVVDLMIAKTWSGEEFNLREELNEFKEEIGEDIPDITILQAVALNVSGQCRRQNILGLKSGNVKDNWEDVIESLRKSIDFLENNINLPTLDLIPYPAQLVPLSKFFFERGNEEPTKSQKEKLIRWFWKSSVANRFDSAVETKLEDDGKSMEDIVEERPTEFVYTYLQRTAEDIINQEYSLRNAFVKTLICLFASQQPVNPVNNSPVSHDNFSKYKQSEMHHIFPRNYLQDQDVDSDLINSVANIMFLPANINKDKKFSDAPGEYLEQIENSNLEEALETHLIANLGESGLMENEYNQFLNYRARQILNKLEEVTGEEEIMTKGRGLSPETPFTNEMHLRQIVRQANSYVHWFDKYFTRRGLEFLVEELNPDKVDTVQILTGTAQTDHHLRKDFKKFKQEMEAKGVDVEMRVLSGDTVREIHDRWLISENQAYNILSINTIGRNQYAEITEATSRPPFHNWWEESDDILEDWDEVQRAIS
jgi:hypothetical protein